MELDETVKMMIRFTVALGINASVWLVINTYNLFSINPLVIKMAHYSFAVDGVLVFVFMLSLMRYAKKINMMNKERFKVRITDSRLILYTVGLFSIFFLINIVAGAGFNLK